MTNHIEVPNLEGRELMIRDRWVDHGRQNLRICKDRDCFLGEYQGC